MLVEPPGSVLLLEEVEVVLVGRLYIFLANCFKILIYSYFDGKEKEKQDNTTFLKVQWQYKLHSNSVSEAFIEKHFAMCLKIGALKSVCMCVNQFPALFAHLAFQPSALVCLNA